MLNVVVFVVSASMCFINQGCRGYVADGLLRDFLYGYFNDYVGSISFIAACNIGLNWLGLGLRRWYAIVLLMVASGVYWEYITPIYRNDVTADVLDIVAYILGGLTYWLIVFLYNRNKNI